MFDYITSKSDIYDLYPDGTVGEMLDRILADAQAAWPERGLYSLSTGWVESDDISVIKFRGTRGDALVQLLPSFSVAS